MNKLIILTYQYPYSPPTEVFLHNELLHQDLSDYDILLIPTATEIEYGKKYNINNDIRVLKKSKCSLIQTCISFIFLLRFLLDDCKNEHYNIQIIPCIIKNYLWLAWKCNEYIDGILSFVEEKDNVILYSYWFGVYAMLGCVIKDRIERQLPGVNIKAVARAHGQGDLYSFIKTRKRIGKNLIEKHLNTVCPISKSGAKILQQQLNNVNIIPMPLGVDGPNYYCKSVVRNEYLVVSCSTVNDNKRVDKIFRTINEISDQYSIKWVHFGDGDRFSDLTGLIKTVEKKNVTIELMKSIDNEMILQYYDVNKPDLFINMSLIEGIPVSIMEAMSYSIPVIAPNIGAVGEIVIDGNNGILIDVNEQESRIATIIEDYFELNIEHRNRFRYNAYMTWKINYNAAKNYKCMLEFLRIS